jgi:hypothetical protein
MSHLDVGFLPSAYLISRITKWILIEFRNGHLK